MEPTDRRERVHRRHGSPSFRRPTSRKRRLERSGDTSTSEPGPGDDTDDEANASLDTDSSDYDSEDGNESVGSRERVPEAVVLVSGGTDSATAVYDAMERGYDSCFCHISHGQRTAAKEAACARRLADIVDAPDFPGIDVESLAQVGGSSLTDRDIEVADADLDSEAIPSSYVPFRNANPLAMATAYAQARGSAAVFIGAHSEGFSGYPDCRSAFFDAFQDVIDQGTKPETEIDLVAPFARESKTDVLRRGLDLGVSYEHTWSCYRADEPACGTCEACAYRLQAFERVGVRDPIPYETRPEYACKRLAVRTANRFVAGRATSHMASTDGERSDVETVGLDHVAIRVTDLDRALEFYSDLLGMTVRDREKFEDDELPFVACVAGSQHLHVVPVDREEIDVGGEHVCLLLRSNNTDTQDAIDDLLDSLREEGVAVEEGEPIERLGAYGRDWAAYVRDPDGRRVELKFH